MTLTLDLTPTEEAQLDRMARLRGTAPAEFVRKLVQEHFVQEHLPPLTAPAPNESALAALQDIAAMKQGLSETDGSQTDRQIREGRAGAMHGL